jgi:hypothetical protein
MQIFVFFVMSLECRIINLAQVQRRVQSIAVALVGGRGQRLQHMETGGGGLTRIKLRISLITEATALKLKTVTSESRLKFLSKPIVNSERSFIATPVTASTVRIAERLFISHNVRVRAAASAMSFN